jgi:shikimate kinase
VTTKSQSAARGRESLEQRIARRLGGRAVVMVGMMGAGKSSVGRRLANRLGLPFVDADSEIEQAANASIPEIFEKHGEAYFRDGERRVIKRLLDGQSKVLATGGGAFIQPETRADIQASGISVWLKADIDLLMARVRRRNNRPLLKTADPEATLTQLMKERYPIYAEATIQVQSRDVAHDVVIDDILAALDSYLVADPNGRGDTDG